VGRDLPVDCGDCGGILNWGDFGPFYDGSIGATCACELKRGGVKSRLKVLVQMYKDHHKGSDITHKHELVEAVNWVMDEVWMLRAENRELRIMNWIPSDQLIEDIGKDVDE